MLDLYFHPDIILIYFIIVCFRLRAHQAGLENKV